jgi:hypothetical protein
VLFQAAGHQGGVGRPLFAQLVMGNDLVLEGIKRTV